MMCYRDIDDEGMLRVPKVLNERRPYIEHGALDAVRGIIVHQTGGKSAESSLSSYSKPGANGAHFLIAKDGTIYQTASVYKVTWHVGKLKARCVAEHTCAPAKVFSPSKENDAEMKKSVPQRYPANIDAIGIELVGATDAKGIYETVTQEQNVSLSWLVKFLSTTFGVAMTEVFRHPDVSRKTETEASTANWTLPVEEPK